MTVPDERPKRVLAVDFGDSRTGLASTDWTGTIRIPLDPIDLRNDDAGVAQEIAKLCRQRETQRIVVGLPLSRDGSEGPRAQRTRKFIEVLKKAVDLEVDTVDESHSTTEAHERLKAMGVKAAKRKHIEDSVAALVILERYLGF